MKIARPREGLGGQSPPKNNNIFILALCAPRMVPNVNIARPREGLGVEARRRRLYALPGIVVFALKHAEVIMHFQPDALLLIGHGSPDAAGNAEFYRFAEDLGQYLGVAIQPCFLELAEPSIEEGFARCVASGARRIAALPLFLGAGRHQKRDVPDLLTAARDAHPGVILRYGAPLGSQLHLIDVLAARAAAALARSSRPVPSDATALLVVGRGSKDPQSNAELPRLARLLAEIYGHALVEYGYQAVVAPDVAQAVTRCVRLGAQRVVVLPYLLFTGFVRDDIARQARAAQEHYPEVEILVGEHLFPHPGLLTAAAARYREIVEGTAAMTCDLCIYRRRAIDADAHAQHPDAHHHHRHLHHSDEEVRP